MKTELKLHLDSEIYGERAEEVKQSAGDKQKRAEETARAAENPEIGMQS